MMVMDKLQSNDATSYKIEGVKFILPTNLTHTHDERKIMMATPCGGAFDLLVNMEHPLVTAMECKRCGERRSASFAGIYPTYGSKEV